MALLREVETQSAFLLPADAMGSQKLQTVGPPESFFSRSMPRMLDGACITHLTSLSLVSCLVKRLRRSLYCMKCGKFQWLGKPTTSDSWVLMQHARAIVRGGSVCVSIFCGCFCCDACDSHPVVVPPGYLRTGPEHCSRSSRATRLPGLERSIVSWHRTERILSRRQVGC